MSENVIWIKSRRFYLYDTYETYSEARKEANYYKKHNRSRWFILKVEGSYQEGTLYKLYLTNTIRLW